MSTTRHSAECTALAGRPCRSPRSGRPAEDQELTASPMDVASAASNALMRRYPPSASRRSARPPRDLAPGVALPHRTEVPGLASAQVVVLSSVAQEHGVRRLLHAGQQRREQLLLGEDEARAAVVGELVLVGHRQRPGRARLDAQAAEDAAGVVDLVRAPVALTRREPLLVGVVRTLDVDRVGRAGPGAQLAADALLQAVGVAVELVPAVEARRRRPAVPPGTSPSDLLEHGVKVTPKPATGFWKPGLVSFGLLSHRTPPFHP